MERWKVQWKVPDLLADGWYSRVVQDFLSSTDVGMQASAVAEDDTVRAVSELEVWRWLDKQGGGAEEADAGGTPLFLPTPDFIASAGTV